MIIYPIKSLAGIEVNHLEVEKSVLKYKNVYDRHWLVIDEQGRVLTVRNEPRLAQIQLSYVYDHLVLKASNMIDLHLHPIEQVAKGDLVYPIKVWGQDIEGLYAGDKESKWFARFLDKKAVKLLQFHPKLARFRKGGMIEGRKAVPSAKNPIRYQDEGACLVVNEASCADLKDRLKRRSSEEGTDKDFDDITYRRFRPNVLVAGFEPYAEDRWTVVRLGTCLLETRIPCGRCRVTTLNTDTLEFGEEPLRSLRTYRMGTPGIHSANTPVMGVYLQGVHLGTIRVEDLVYTD